MLANGTPWAIVLAAGDGSRLRSLTADENGRTVPKQYCSLWSGPSLLASALARARSVAPSERILTIVAAHHRPFWERELDDLPEQGLIVQPRNRGTAAGLLLPLFTVLERDPDARICVLPSDHHVRSESILSVALQVALRSIDAQLRSVVLLGITPQSAEEDYGWILPRSSRTALANVKAFVEKPTPAVARRLFEAGALWNSFLLAARARALIELYAARQPRLVAGFRAAFDRPRSERGSALERLYEELEPSDFSRHVLQGSEPRLQVLTVPPCGWTDLGTPQRVAACLRQSRPTEERPRTGAVIELARTVELHSLR